MDKSQYPKTTEEIKGVEIHHAENLNGFDVNHNQDASIKNPLTHFSSEAITEDVRIFAETHGLADIMPLLVKGALIAKDPALFEEVPGMSDHEKQCIRNEVLHKWRQPKALYLSVALTCIGAAVQGWDQTGSNGANLGFPEALGIPVTDTLADGVSNPNANLNQWIQGLINAAPYLISAVVACWLSDPLHHYLGRRGATFVSAIFCILAPIGSGVAQTWEQLLVTRLLLGVGMGIKLATMAIYAAECAPTPIRGGLVSLWLVWTCFGILLGTCANLAVKDTGDIAWRLQFASAFIPAVPLALGIYFCPERVRRATLASFVVMIAQQMCGSNIVAFYSATIFVEAGSTVTAALAATCGYALVVLVFAFVAVYTIDSFGRRSLLLLTFPFLFLSLLAAGFCFYIDADNPAHIGLIATFIYIFGAFYAAGEGAVPYVYSSEVFPLSHRELGMSWAVATTTFWATALSLTFPRMFAAFGPTGTFGFYAGCNLLALLMIFLWLPETKGRTLEEIDYIFGVSTRKFMSHQVLRVSPWWIKRYIFRSTHAESPTLYGFEGHVGNDAAFIKAVRENTRAERMR